MAKTKGISIKKEIGKYGDVYYYNEQNQLHREGGPAVECANGDKEWWYNGKLHRVDGPAVKTTEGYCAWWYNDKLIGKSFDGYTQEKFERWQKLRAFQ